MQNGKSFKDMTLEELEAEHKYWDDKFVNATSWGGALTAADEFRRDCARHIKLRKQLNIMDAG